MPVLVLNASRTFWKLSCSLPPHSDMTLIVAPAAADALALAPGLPLAPGLAPGAQAAASRAATTTNARARADRTMPVPPRPARLAQSSSARVRAVICAATDSYGTRPGAVHRRGQAVPTRLLARFDGTVS